MPKIEIVMTEEEKLALQFRLFEYNGLRINIEQFVHSDREYNKDHFDRLFNVMLEKYSLLQECLLSIIAAHGHKKVPIKSYDFFLNYDVLTVHV